MVPKRIGHKVTAHGFRSTFKDWCSEHTSYADEVSELALAHVGSDSTRAAYARSELLDRRRKMMDEWQGFCRNGLTETHINVTNIGGAR
jgi:integrase